MACWARNHSNKQLTAIYNVLEIEKDFFLVSTVYGISISMTGYGIAYRSLTSN